MMITTICSDDDTHCRYQPNLTSWPLPFYCSLTCDLLFFKYDVSMAIIYLLPSTSYRFYVNYYNCLDCLCLFCFRTCHLSNAAVVTPAGVYNLKTSCPLPPALDLCTPLVLEYCPFCMHLSLLHVVYFALLQHKEGYHHQGSYGYAFLLLFNLLPISNCS